MAQHYRFVGEIRVPKGTVIPEHEKSFITSQPHSGYFCQEGEFDCYFITAPGSTCNADPEDTTKAIIKHAKKLNALHVIGRIVWDKDDVNILER